MSFAEKKQYVTERWLSLDQDEEKERRDEQEETGGSEGGTVRSNETILERQDTVYDLGFDAPYGSLYRPAHSNVSDTFARGGRFFFVA